VLPVLLAATFAAANLVDMAVDQGFTGVFTTWSVGLYLFLPWPVYAAALAIFSYAVLTCFSRAAVKSPYADSNTGLGLLLLLYAGYQLQLPFQHLLALLSLLLLTRLSVPFAEAPSTTPGAIPSPTSPTT
jgi:hypothetical protein